MGRTERNRRPRPAAGQAAAMPRAGRKAAGLALLVAFLAAATLAAGAENPPAAAAPPAVAAPPAAAAPPPAGRSPAAGVGPAAGQEPAAAVWEGDTVIAGRENWQKPWLPDLRNPGRRIEVPEAGRIDVVLLGDGYLAAEREAFAGDVRSWYAEFLKLTPWKQLCGVFRVRGIWTPSLGRGPSAEGTYYRVQYAAQGLTEVQSAETRRALYGALGRIGINEARLSGRLTHTVVVMLVRTGPGPLRSPSGCARTLASPDGKTTVRVAFGAYTHHEFGHAWAGLGDEYINIAKPSAAHTTPARPSIFTVSNLCYTKDPLLVPWRHLAPGSPLNPDPGSVIGVLWVGGVREEGAWHGEARCLMNGRHDNWDLQKTRRGASLRDPQRFCFWCEEIAVARTWLKAGQPGNAAGGEELWEKWVREVRPLYQKAFDVAARIKGQNEANARERLAEAKIYERPALP